MKNEAGTPSQSIQPRQVLDVAGINRVLRALDGQTLSHRRKQWLQAVAAKTTHSRPDIRAALLEVLGVEAAPADILRGLTIGEIGVCYEALVATSATNDRRAQGQFFTPDDAAKFMASMGAQFPDGQWLDPCCGVGNLAWHLVASQTSPHEFLQRNLALNDQDETAVRSAVALLAADFSAPNDSQAVVLLNSRSTTVDFLSSAATSSYDYAILNPPYARTAAREEFRTAKCRDLFAYFIEKVAATTKGYICVTPASYLTAPKFAPLREVVADDSGGQIFVFDNVPDTLFRGYKFGSHNTSKTNFVRASITVSEPNADEWNITPILRWQTASRAKMFEECPSLLSRLDIGPHGEWAKIAPEHREMWKYLRNTDRALSDLVRPHPTPYYLEVGTTPRYYISASFSFLQRKSKATLYFSSSEDRDLAAVVLNSSVPYFWWRALDGGVTLPRRVLMSTPIPDVARSGELASQLRRLEPTSKVFKLNAGIVNENVKHAAETVALMNESVIPGTVDLSLLYTNNMFPINGSEP